MLPDVFGEKWFDEFFGFPMDFPKEKFTRVNAHPRMHRGWMKTDVLEDAAGYTLIIDLPGFKKEDLSISVENGYLTVNAKRMHRVKKEDVQEKDAAPSEEAAPAAEAARPRFIYRERFVGSYSRSFYLGDAVNEQDISAAYEDGVLKLSVPKKVPEDAETKRYISIA